MKISIKTLVHILISIVVARGYMNFVRPVGLIQSLDYF